MSVLQGTRTELSTIEQEAIENQLKIVLADPTLNQSKRYQQLLKYIVTETIGGNSDSLKERTLGIEVFARAPDYDTVKDPIVRVSVAALRKRLNAYYSSPEHREQIQIIIPVGSYICRFIWPHKAPPQKEGIFSLLGSPIDGEVDKDASLPIHDPSSTQIVGPNLRIETSAPSLSKSREFRHVIVTAICLSFLAILTIFVYRAKQHPSIRSASRTVWSPLVTRDQSPLCAMGQSDTMSAEDINTINSGQRSGVGADSELIRYDDADPLVRIVAHLETDGISCHLSKSSALSLSDLRQGPDILIGAFNNAWTLRLTEPLRFHFGNDMKSHSLWIEDAKTMKRWKSSPTDQNSAIKIDYAIIARYRDDLTNEPTLVVAGLGSGGTIAAGQFVTDPAYIESLAKTIGLKAVAMNFEIVIETELINGKPGAPHVVSSYSWL